MCTNLQVCVKQPTCNQGNQLGFVARCVSIAVNTGFGTYINYYIFHVVASVLYRSNTLYAPSVFGPGSILILWTFPKLFVHLVITHRKRTPLATFQCRDAQILR